MRYGFLAVLICLGALAAGEPRLEAHFSALVAADDPIENCLDTWGSVDDPDYVSLPASIALPGSGDTPIPGHDCTDHSPALPYDPCRARGPPDSRLI